MTASCSHNWVVDRVQNWYDGKFTLYLGCSQCDASSFIEGHADENSDSTPTLKEMIE